jgi:hypothetical protein
MPSRVNQVVEQMVRAGIGGPCTVGGGVVVIETKGRTSGARRTIPVLAQRFGNTLIVSTIRTNSQWVRNMQADESPSVVVDKVSRPVSVAVRRVGRLTVLRLDLL